MDFEFTDDQAELQRAVRDVLDKECPPTVPRAVAEGTPPDGSLWETLCSLDWPALALPEELGGLGATWVEQAIVIEELGRTVAPTPYLPTITQFVPAVVAAGTPEQAKRFVEPVVNGGSTGTLAVDDGAGTWSPDDVAATLTPIEGGGFRLDGTKRAVMHGATADEVVVAAKLEGRVELVVVPGDAATPTDPKPIDATTPHCDLTYDGVVVEADRLLVGETETVDALADASEQAAVGLAVSTVGTCQAILDMTVAYAKERKQFDVPIGSFQAVKHKLVDLYRDVEKARALGYFAALCFAEGDPRRSIAAAMAKAAAGDCQRRAAQDGLQLHGGIGYTWEHDLHLYLRRAKATEPFFGGSSQHRNRVAWLRLAQG